MSSMHEISNNDNKKNIHNINKSNNINSSNCINKDIVTREKNVITNCEEGNKLFCIEVYNTSGDSNVSSISCSRVEININNYYHSDHFKTSIDTIDMQYVVTVAHTSIISIWPEN